MTAVLATDQELYVYGGRKKVPFRNASRFPLHRAGGGLRMETGQEGNPVARPRKGPVEGAARSTSYLTRTWRQSPRSDAESRLAAHLAARGATVKVGAVAARAPGADGKPVKVGLDDFLVEAGDNGPRELRALLNAAEEPSPPEAGHDEAGGQ